MRILLWILTGLVTLPLAVRAGQEDADSLTLDQALQLALSSNAAIRASQAAVTAADYRVRKAKLDLLPKAHMLFDYTRFDAGSVRRSNALIDGSRALFDTLRQTGLDLIGNIDDIRPAAYRHNFSTTFQVIQPIYNGGANWAAVGFAQAQKRRSEHSLEDSRQQVVMDVKRRYFQVLQTKEIVELARRGLNASQEHLKQAQNMMDVGLRSRTDVLRWQVKTASDRGALLEAESNLTVAFAALNQVLGRPFDKKLKIVPISTEPEELETPLADHVEKARLDHPQMSVVASSVDEARAAVRLASSALKPKLNLVYQVGWERNNTLALDSFSFWNAGLSLNVPLFPGFGNVIRVRESRAELHRLQETRTQGEQLVTLELIRSRSRVETSLKKYRIAQEAAKQARENLKVLDNTFAVGLAANIDVLDGQVALHAAEAGVIRARYDYWIARAELNRALGIRIE